MTESIYKIYNITSAVGITADVTDVTSKQLTIYKTIYKKKSMFKHISKLNYARIRSCNAWLSGIMLINNVKRTYTRYDRPQSM